MNTGTADYSAFMESNDEAEGILPQALDPETLTARARAHQFRTGLRETATSFIEASLLIFALTLTTLVVFAVLMLIRADPLPTYGGTLVLGNIALMGLGFLLLRELRVATNPGFNERDRYHLVNELDLELMMQTARIYPQCMPFMRNIAAQNRLPTYHEREALDAYTRSVCTHSTLRNWVKMADELEDIDAILQELDELGTLIDEPVPTHPIKEAKQRGRVLLMPYQANQL
ncbi:MAG: hypothetical protein EA349_13730 [Halomonadaceae bacterium]|nr:MAG: hypothetical protein EA349_13730 [Halomonadaceae bacterium]